MSYARQGWVLTAVIGLGASACVDRNTADTGESEASTSSTQTTGAPGTSTTSETGTETGEPAETETGEPAETETGEPSETETGDPSDTDTDTDTDTDSDTETDTDTESDTEDEGWAEAETGEMGEELCAGAGWDPQQVVASIRDLDSVSAHLLRADGSTMSLDTSLPGADPNDELGLLVDVEGDYAIALVYTLSSGYRGAYRVYDRDSGALVWEFVDTEAEPQGRPAYLGPDGRVAFFVNAPIEGDQGYSQVVGPNGQEALFVGDVRGYVDADQWIPMEVGESSPRWRNIDTEETLSASYGIWEAYSFTWEDDGTLVYLAEVDGSMALVEQRLDLISSITPWPELDAYLFNGWWLSASAPHARWMMITNDVEKRILRLDPDDVSEEFVLSPPPGYLEPGCAYQRYAFDDLGGLVSTWTDGDSTNAWLLPEPGAQWQALDIFFDVTHARAKLGHVSGTFWMEGDAANSPECGLSDNPPPEALPGDSIQLARPSAGTSVASPHTELYGLALTRDGLCAARATSDEPGQPWRIDDLVNGTWIEAPEPGQVRWHP